MRKRPKREAEKQAPGYGEIPTCLENAQVYSGEFCSSGVLLGSPKHSANIADPEKDRQLGGPQEQRLVGTSDPGTSSGLSLVSTRCGKRRRLATMTVFEPPTAPNNAFPASNSSHLIGLTDAVLRLSIFLHLRGSIPNLRLKASTFYHGLSNIAPALWRTGYLSVREI